eukprot:ctg_1261.g552
MGSRGRVLVTGGAGYIGSHTVAELLHAGYDVLVVDNLINASEESLRRVRELTGTDERRLAFQQVDLLDAAALDAAVAAGGPFRACIHFAGLKAVGESVEQPLRYYKNNLGGTLNLLQSLHRHGCRKFVFSSSATVYQTVHRGVSARFTRVTARRQRVAHSYSALLQPGRRARVGTHRRGPVRHPQQPHAVHCTGGGRPPRVSVGVRQRLSDARRHRGARLHPRGGSGTGPRGCSEQAGGRRGERGLRGGEFGHRQGLLGAGHGESVREGVRQADSLQDRGAAPRRHRHGVRRPGLRQAVSGMGGATRSGGHVRIDVEVAESESVRVSESGLVEEVQPCWWWWWWWW